MLQYLYSFVVGGTITTLIILFEEHGFFLLSRLAALFPVFTWMSYLFIGALVGTKQVSSHALFVLLGTLVAWVPYMLFTYLFVERLGIYKTIICAILLFTVLALTFSYFYPRGE